MSQLTAELLGQKKCRRNSPWPGRLARAAELLVAAYGEPTLGNYRDPIKEMFYILLSARTSEALYQPAFRRLFARYPRLTDLAGAHLRGIAVCIAGAGLGRKRARLVRGLARRLRDDFGSRARRQLKAMPARDLYEYLVSLPGLGPKSALCVMMYSLDFDVLPVDVNVQRIAARMGVLEAGLKHYQAQNELPRFVPPGVSRQLHVGMMVHGRTICLPRQPLCNACFLVELCQTGRRRASATLRARTAPN